ncbi:MAG TPA: hypothetical protein VN718_02540 [Rhizomicrobium sp.]|jgi:hypothetical protein|nr:hypothetical protein [Rhizomicrobium sp.]
MRQSGILLTSAASLLLAGSAMAQSSGGSMSGGNMSGGSMAGPSMSGGGMQMNAQGGVGIFSRENMAMMIVDREKATKGMTEDQAKAARQEEMSKDRAETPEQRQARKARYDSEWMQLTAAEKQDAMTKLDAQMKARGMMAAPPASK